jgi:hypothetical protein
MKLLIGLFAMIFLGCGGSAFQASDPCAGADCTATSTAGSWGTLASSGAAGAQAGTQAGGPCLTCTGGAAGQSSGVGGDTRPAAEAGSDARVADAGPAMVDVDSGGSMPTPSLFIIVDRTWYSVDSPLPPAGAQTAWSVFSAGLKQFAKESTDVPIALLYEPAAGKYATPAVDFTTDAQLIAKSIDALPATVGTGVTGADMSAAVSGAIQYIQSKKPERCGLVFLTNVMDSSWNSVFTALMAANPPIQNFLVAQKGQQSSPSIAGHQFAWANSPDEVAAALHAVVGKLNQ